MKKNEKKMQIEWSALERIIHKLKSYLTKSEASLLLDRLCIDSYHEQDSTADRSDNTDPLSHKCPRNPSCIQVQLGDHQRSAYFQPYWI